MAKGKIERADLCENGRGDVGKSCKTTVGRSSRDLRRKIRSVSTGVLGFLAHGADCAKAPLNELMGLIPDRAVWSDLIVVFMSCRHFLIGVFAGMSQRRSRERGAHPLRGGGAVKNYGGICVRTGCRTGCSRLAAGEDVSERLDVISAQFRVLVIRQPEYARRGCESVVAQAPAPSRFVEGGLPTEAVIAQVLVSIYADQLPLYRQAQIFAWQGVALDRSTLADWVDRAAWHLRPVYERRLADETTAPVLDPGRGRTKTGQTWVYARDDRPWGGADPPAVAYVYAPDRKAEQPIAHLTGFAGVLQVDGDAGYRALAKGNAVRLAFCWAHVRRRF